MSFQEDIVKMLEEDIRERRVSKTVTLEMIREVIYLIDPQFEVDGNAFTEYGVKNIITNKEFFNGIVLGMAFIFSHFNTPEYSYGPDAVCIYKLFQDGLKAHYQNEIETIRKEKAHAESHSDGNSAAQSQPRETLH